MSSLNRAMLIGRLGGDPEIRQVGNQTVANFSLATTSSWTDKQGQKQKRTDWHRIVVWGKMAELCQRFLSKGRMVFVEGRIQNREWNDREGNKRYTTEVIAAQVTFLDGRNSDQPTIPNEMAMNNDPESATAAGLSNGNFSPTGQQGNFDYGPAPTDDDVPF